MQYRVVAGASPDAIVRGDARAMRDAFVAAGRDLVRAGCDGIVTNCGFLALIQHDLRAALGVPVATSALMQVGMVRQTLAPDRRVGVLTISRETLTDAHLAAAGVPTGTPVVGTDPDCAFTRGILGDAAEIDFAACREDLLDAAHRLVSQHDGIGAIVLECTNMVPYARAIRAATGLPVYSIHSLVTWFQSALMPRAFPLELDDARP